MSRARCIQFIVLISCVIWSGCGTTARKSQEDVPQGPKPWYGKMICYNNTMPMTTSGAYLLIGVYAPDGFKEPVRIAKLVATSTTDTWETTTFEQMDYCCAQDTALGNRVNKFNVSIGGQFDVQLFMETESKDTTIVVVKNVQVQHVQ